MLPHIPDNDTDTCWARGCDDPATAHTGLCFVHNAAIRPFLVEERREMTGRAWDLLGLRLNVLHESRGACLREPGPCEIRLCRHHLDDRLNGESIHPEEPCAVKLGNRGGMILDEIAAVMGGGAGITRERVRQIELAALRSLKKACQRAGISLVDVVPKRRRVA